MQCIGSSSLASTTTSLGNALQQRTEPHTPHPAQVLAPRQLAALTDLERQDQQVQAYANTSQWTNLVSASQRRTERTRRHRRMDSRCPSPRRKERSHPRDRSGRRSTRDRQSRSRRRSAIKAITEQEGILTTISHPAIQIYAGIATSTREQMVLQG